MPLRSSHDRFRINQKRHHDASPITKLTRPRFHPSPRHRHIHHFRPGSYASGAAQATAVCPFAQDI